MDEKELAETARQCGLTGMSYSKVEDAFNAAKGTTDKDDLVVITGSNFLVADILRYLPINVNFT
jgi:folylpolyglutamate synthase/dihydropteroate synthase